MFVVLIIDVLAAAANDFAKVIKNEDTFHRNTKK